jgi:FkbM family methyltransferase
MVGSAGRVVAFEPDRSSLVCLERNIRDQKISNVTIVRKAIDAKTGTAYFNADGTMGAGLVDYSVYSNTGQRTAVEVLSLEDACGQFGVPQFTKMDIEGAEIAVIRSAGEFLKAHPMHLAFDSYHRMRDGRFTWMLLEPLLRSLGYEVGTSADFGQMFTWARASSLQ